MVTAHIIEDYCSDAGLSISTVADGVPCVLEFDHEIEVTFLPDRERLVMVTRLCPLVELSDEKLLELLEARLVAPLKFKEPFWMCLATDMEHSDLLLLGRCEWLRTRDDFVEAIEALLERRLYWLNRIQSHPETNTEVDDLVKFQGLPDYTMFV